MQFNFLFLVMDLEVVRHDMVTEMSILVEPKSKGSVQSYHQVLCVQVAGLQRGGEVKIKSTHLGSNRPESETFGPQLSALTINMATSTYQMILPAQAGLSTWIFLIHLMCIYCLQIIHELRQV